MCTDGAGQDDDEEQGGDDAGNAVQDDHGNSGRGRGAKRVLLLHVVSVGIAAAALDLDKILHVDSEVVDVVEHGGRVGLVRHGQHGEAGHGAIVVVVVAVVGHGAVQDDARDVGISVAVGLVEDCLGVDEAGVVGRVAADVGDVAVGHVGGGGAICAVQIALDRALCALARQRYQLGNLLSVAGALQRERALEVARVDRRCVGRCDAGRRRASSQSEGALQPGEQHGTSSRGGRGGRGGRFVLIDSDIKQEQEQEQEQA